MNKPDKRHLPKMYTLVITMNWNRFRNSFRIRFCIFYNRSELSQCPHCLVTAHDRESKEGFQPGPVTMVRGGCDIGSLIRLRKKKKVSLGYKLAKSMTYFGKFALKMLTYLGIYMPSLPMWQVSHPSMTHVTVGEKSNFKCITSVKLAFFSFNLPPILVEGLCMYGLIQICFLHNWIFWDIVIYLTWLAWQDTKMGFWDHLIQMAFWTNL